MPPNSKVKTPRFFCEGCGAEVAKDAERCFNCGKSFASIRCAACNFTGEEALFNKGCPVCGYEVNATPKNLKIPPVKQTKVRAGNLPLWVYILTAAVFTAVMAALLFRS